MDITNDIPIKIVLDPRNISAGDCIMLGTEEYADYLSADQARMLAARLVAAADMLDPDADIDFANILEAVKNT